MPTSPKDKAAFWHALAASPTDEFLHNAFADWLEERGDGRAAFFRDLTRAPLEELDVSCNYLHDAGAGALLRAKELSGLREQKLGTTFVGDSTAYRLAEAGHLNRLESLDLIDNSFSVPGVAALARSPHLAGLRHLSLTSNPIRDDGLRELAAAPSLRSITSLSLSRVGGTAPGFDPLLRSDTVASVEELHLGGDPLVGIGDALAKSPTLGRLKSLPLGFGGLGAADARRLGAATNLPRLEGLWLSGNPLGREGIAALLGGALPGQLIWLDLDRCGVGNPGAERLACCPSLPGLRSLSLDDNRITDKGALALARSPHLGMLASLSLSGNKIGVKCKRVLRERFGEDACYLDDSGASRMRGARCLDRVSKPR